MTIQPGFRAVLFLSAAALLVACNKQDPASDKTANVAAPATPSVNTATPSAAANAGSSAAPAPAAAVNADFLVGKWSAMGEDCSATVEFRRDGTAVTPAGQAKWKLTGDKLRLEYGDGSQQPVSTIKPLGSDRMETTTESGNKDTQKRC